MLRALIWVAAALAFLSAEAVAQPTPTASSALYFNDGYYPESDSAADLDRVIARATADDKRILVVVGGDWCVWCHILDRFLADNADVRVAFADSFLILKVNWSRENKNDQFLGQYPEAVGYPDFLILESDGRFLEQQRTDLLESGRSYDRTRMLAFARRWRAS
jgi:thiol:disulfide interchange protein